MKHNIPPKQWRVILYMVKVSKVIDQKRVRIENKRNPTNVSLPSPVLVVLAFTGAVGLFFLVLACALPQFK